MGSDVISSAWWAPIVYSAWLQMAVPGFYVLHPGAALRPFWGKAAHWSCVVSTCAVCTVTLLIGERWEAIRSFSFEENRVL